MAEQEEAQPPSLAIPPGTAAARSPDAQRPLDSGVIRKAEQELAKDMGPIAPRLVRKAATQATTPEELYNSLAAKIPKPRRTGGFSPPGEGNARRPGYGAGGNARSISVGGSL
jgi:hypothetical protein